MDIASMVQTGDDATIIQAVEMIGNDAVVLGSIPVTGNGTYRISFKPTGSSVQLWVLGAYDILLKPTCYTYSVTTQETYLVDICDENKDRYRFGFNGQENVNEVYEKGNFQDYGMRDYDPRIARLNLRVDPLTKNYPELTPYQFASNRPIDEIDLDGMEYENFNALNALYLTNLTVPDEEKLSTEQIHMYGEVMNTGQRAGVVLGAAIFIPGATYRALGGFWGITNSLIFNQQAQFFALSTLAGLAGYGGPDIPEVGVVARATTTVRWTESRMISYGNKLSYVVNRTASLTMHEGAKFETAAEKMMAQKLLSEGNAIEVLKEAENQVGVRTADYLINGIPTELKTVTNMTSNNPVSAVSRLVKKSSGQGSSLILDFSGQSGVSREQIIEGVNAYWKRGGQSKESVRIIGKGFDEVLTKPKI